eukprot:m.463375 g.463375  ORF g.463375 m.463375 type:complete len:56 (+) comp22998_c0_seq1:1266-1433(+)
MTMYLHTLTRSATNSRSSSQLSRTFGNAPISHFDRGPLTTSLASSQFHEAGCVVP